MFGVLQLAVVTPELGFGNDSYYVRDAMAFADGEVAHSRYSPGLPVLLVPIVWASAGDPEMVTLIGRVLMTLVAVVALFLTFRFLLRHVSEWVAVALVVILAFGQAGSYLSGIAAETPILALVAAVLLLPSERSSGVVGAVLSGLGVAIRIAIAPFFAVLWLFRLKKRPLLAGFAIVLIAAAGLAHFATRPMADQSYFDMAGAIYGVDDGSAIENALGQVGEGFFGYARYGIPRLVWPYRVLETLVGWPMAIGTLLAMAWGLVARKSSLKRALSLGAVAGTLAYLALVLAWPIRESGAVRMVVPVAPVLLAGLGISIDRLRAVKLGNWITVGLVGLVALNLAAGASAYVQGLSPDPREESFRSAHRMAVGSVPGPVISGKPAITELILGVPAYLYPIGDPTPADLELFAESLEACDFVVEDDIPSPLFDWVYGRTVEVYATAGATSLVRIDETWCS